MSAVKIYIAKNEKQGSDIIWQRKMGKNLLTAGIRAWLGDEKFVPNIKTSESGKPYIINSSLRFNISHSMRYVVCAIGEQEVGIDIQFHKKNNIDSVARRIMAGKEWQDYQKAVDKAKFFFDLWAKKESYLKYTGDGIRSDLRLLNIDAYVQEVVVDDDYSCMLCTQEACEYEVDNQ